MAKIDKNKEDCEYRTYQFLIKEGHDLHAYLMDIMYNANNLYNTTNFYIRQIWTGAKIEDENKIHPLQKEVLSIVRENILAINEHNTLKFQKLVKKDILEGRVLTTKRKLTRFNMPNKEKAFPSYELLDAVFKTSKNKDYKSIPSHINQSVMKNVYNNWTSYFESMKEYKENASKFTGRPKIPRYKTKGATHSIIFSNQVCTINKDKRGKFYLKLPKTKLRFNLSKHLLEKLNDMSLAEVRAQKYYNEIQLEIVLKVKNPINMMEEDKIKNVMSVDLGVNNLVACVSNNEMTPTIINGKPLKSINQYYNKKRAKLYSDLRVGKSTTEGLFTSKRLEILDKKRQLQVKDFMHKASKQIIDLVKENDIHKVIVGYNKNFQSNVDIGKKNTQNFVNIPFGTFLNILEYKLKGIGVHFEKVDESYTSKSSFIDKDEIPTYEKNNSDKYTFSGKRIKRGLYQTKNRIIINADINGACNILKKNFDENLEISHKILSNVRKINIPKGHKKRQSTLDKLFKNKGSMILV